jgi:hypothetical protein
MGRSNEPKVHCCYFAGLPAFAQAQKPRVTKDDAQKVMTIIRSDKAKTKTYCEIQDLGEQMERAYEKRNLKLVDELLQKIDALEESLGPEYVALIEGLDLIDPEKDKLGHVDIRSTERAVCEVSLENPKAPAATRDGTF